MPGSGPRLTLPTQLVLRVLLADPGREVYGAQVAAAAELPSGTVHPLLARLEGFGWLDSRWEATDPRESGRPRRRYYRLTPVGVSRAETALASVHLPSGLRARLRPEVLPAGDERWPEAGTAR